MARFKRLCVDVDDWGVVVGGSCEYYDDSQVPHVATAVLSGPQVDGKSRERVLAELDALGWPQESLPLLWPTDTVRR